MLGDRVSSFAPDGAFFRTGDSRSLLNTSLNPFAVGDTYTVAAWVRFISLVTGDIVRLFPANNNNDILSLGLKSPGQFQFSASDSAGVVIKNLIPVSPLPVVDRWYHIVGCKLGSSVMRIFINGEDALTTGVTVPTTTNAARQISIGIDGRDSSGQLDADIHSVALWNTAISEESVRAIYNGGYKDLDLRVAHPCYAEAINLVHWWRFGQGSTASFPDGNDFMSDWQLDPPLSAGISITEEGGDVDDEDILLVDTGSRGTVMKLDGSGGSLSSSVAVPIGIANEWSISTWIRPLDISTADQSIFCICDGTQSLIEIGIVGTAPNDPLVVALNTDNVVTEILRTVSYNDVLSFDVWHHLLVTWDGAIVKTYLNSELLTPSSLVSNPGVQSDNSRFATLGADSEGGAPANFFDGSIGHTAIWDVAMDEDAVCQIYGGAHCLDLRFNKDAYQVAANLKRYWKPGEDTQAPGRDFTNVHKSTSIPIATVTGTLDIVGGSPVVVDRPPGETLSVSLSGIERYANNTFNLLSIANEWSISTWVNPLGIALVADFGFIVSAIPSSGFTNLISIAMNQQLGAELTAGNIGIDIRSSSASIIKQFFYNNVLTAGAWTHLLATWDGLDFKMFIDGVETARSFTSTDASGTMTNTARKLEYGAQSGGFTFEGNFGHLAIWDTVLEEADATTIFALKFAIDLRGDTGGYLNAASLQHYYRPGFEDEGFEDLGTGSPVIDFVDSVGIDADDIEINFPV